jgi:hypothetical protein
MGLDVQVGHRAVVRATGISPHCVTVCVCEVNNSSTVLDPSYLSNSALTVRVRLCSHDPSIVWTDQSTAAVAVLHMLILDAPVT